MRVDDDSANGDKVIEETAVAEASAVNCTNKTNYKKYFEYASCAFAAFAALIGIIFTFFIGLKVNGSEGVVLESSIITIYDYFGKMYESLSELNSEGSWIQYSDLDIAAYYTYAALGTTVAAIALLSMAVFAIITVLKCVKQFINKEDGANFAKPAIATFLSFAVFSAAFYAFHNVGYVGNDDSMQLYYGDANLAGIILGGISTGAYFVSKFVQRISELKDKKAFFDFTGALAIGLIAIVLTVLIAKPVSKISYDLSLYGQTITYKVSSSCSFTSFITSLVFRDSDENLLTFICCGTIGYVLQTVLIALTAKIVYNMAVRVSEGCGKSSVGTSVSCFVLSAACLAIAVALTVKLTGMNEHIDYTVSYAIPIAVLILNAVMLACIVVINKLSFKTSCAINVQE